MAIAADVASEVISVERAALDRWGAGDPSGYAEIFDDAVTYFDPFQERRLDGQEARELMRAVTGQIRVDRHDMQGARVQCVGDVALSSWNSTEAYRRTPAGWRIFHSHWSFIKPELKDSNPGIA